MRSGYACSVSARASRIGVWIVAAIVTWMLAGPHLLYLHAGSSNLTADPPGSDVCCSPTPASTVAPATRPAAAEHALPIEPSNEIVFRVGKLGCPLIDGVGCGHLLAPALAQIDGIEGVMRSYTNWTGTELRITVAPKADVSAVAERVRAFLAADQQEPVRVEGEALAKSLKDQQWRSLEHVVELTIYEYHTFARQQIGAFADEQHLDAAKKQKLLNLVDETWDKAAKDMGDPSPDSESYSNYWHARLNKLVEMFGQGASVLLTGEQIELLHGKYGSRQK